MHIGAPRNVTLVKFCHVPRPFPSRLHSRSVPYPGNAQPRAGPGDAGEGRAAQAKLLSCGARSEVAAATAASRPLPGLRRPEPHTHWSPPATCPLPCSPGRDSAASPPRAHKKPRFPAQSGWGRAAGAPHLCVPPGGEGVGGRVPYTRGPLSPAEGGKRVCKLESAFPLPPTRGFARRGARRGVGGGKQRVWAWG